MFREISRDSREAKKCVQRLAVYRGGVCKATFVTADMPHAIITISATAAAVADIIGLALKAGDYFAALTSSSLFTLTSSSSFLQGRTKVNFHSALAACVGSA